MRKGQRKDRRKRRRVDVQTRNEDKDESIFESRKKKEMKSRKIQLPKETECINWFDYSKAARLFSI
jgi:hypothetical protein